jgi:hypothetical protein
MLIGWLTGQVREEYRSFMHGARSAYVEGFVKTCSKWEDEAICRCAAEIVVDGIGFWGFLEGALMRRTLGHAPHAMRRAAIEAVDECKRKAVRDCGWGNLGL